MSKYLDRTRLLGRAKARERSPTTPLARTPGVHRTLGAPHSRAPACRADGTDRRRPAVLDPMHSAEDKYTASEGLGQHVHMSMDRHVRAENCGATLWLCTVCPRVRTVRAELHGIYRRRSCGSVPCQNPASPRGGSSPRPGITDEARLPAARINASCAVWAATSPCARPDRGTADHRVNYTSCPATTRTSPAARISADGYYVRATC